MKVASVETSCPGMFQAEAAALERIAASNTIQVPDTLYADAHCLIQTMFIEGEKRRTWHEEIGRGLAHMHQALQSDEFGLHLTSYLGTTAQCNARHSEWLTFWRENRLQPQIVKLAETFGTDDPLIAALEKLSKRLGCYLAASSEQAVFVHGDLWAGNAAADQHGALIIFDPASYYASREFEFGIMRLFGGFGPRTEAAYQEIWPFEDGSDERIEVYRLHHLTNHLIMFGRPYYQEALGAVKALL